MTMPKKKKLYPTPTLIQGMNQTFPIPAKGPSVFMAFETKEVGSKIIVTFVGELSAIHVQEIGTVMAPKPRKLPKNVTIMAGSSNRIDE
jgi:hypothetical protein